MKIVFNCWDINYKFHSVEMELNFIPTKEMTIVLTKNILKEKFEAFVGRDINEYSKQFFVTNIFYYAEGDYFDVLIAKD